MASSAYFGPRPTLDTIYRGIGIPSRDIRSCIKMVADSIQVPIDEAEDRIIQSFAAFDTQCIQQSARHNMKLHPHQEAMVRHMMYYRGGIAAFKVGVGKTLTAAMTIHCCLGVARSIGRPDIQVHIVTPVSLVDNMKKEMKAIGTNPKAKNIHFHSFASYAKKYTNGTLDTHNSILVVDEAHELRTDYRNEFASFSIGSKKNSRAEMFINSAKRAWRVLLLTATPIHAHDHNILNLIAMVNGTDPMTKYEFDKVMQDQVLFENAFGNRIMWQDSNKRMFPKIIEHDIEIEMPEQFFIQYNRIENKIYPKSFVYKKSKRDALYSRMRRATACIMPNPRIEFIIAKIKQTNEQSIIYSDYLSAGVDLITKRLDEEEISYVKIVGATKQIDRQLLVDQYNKGYVKVLVLGKAGGVGLDTKNTRHFFTIEDGWVWNDKVQARGRGARYKSHHGLPKNQRVMNVWNIIVVKPSQSMQNEYILKNRLYASTEKWAELTVDQYLKDRSLQIYKDEIVPLEKKLRKVGIAKKK